MSATGRSARRPAADRRGADRPQNGDIRVCPKCHTGHVEFSERYRRGGGFAPAWVCDNPGCGFEYRVRGNGPFPALRS